MFSERMALKTRLEELDAREVRVAKECSEERERIYERLRKLDEQNMYRQSAMNEEVAVTNELLDIENQTELNTGNKQIILSNSDAVRNF